MRNLRWWNVVVVTGLVFGMSALPALAEETSSAAPAEAAPSAEAPAAPAVPEAPVTPAEAPAVAAPAVPDLKPIVIKFSGEIVQVNRQDAEHPALTVRDRYGVTKEMTSDAKAVEAVKTGDQVTVEYTYDVATGKRQVQTVAVTQAAQAPAATQ
ncbi:MAG: hypothetical protein A3C53_00805 [Omnitrophica WOR_2 bacterium RIFCSPHIGHO2_02_FULL_68_15]|nr:MAG: hypothetical protein A3C53_00805 [Omnitrophica WOR_2 bacterium RIFCSPHIGHO2_02_FULL_68_15]